MDQIILEETEKRMLNYQEEEKVVKEFTFDKIDEHAQDNLSKAFDFFKK